MAINETHSNGNGLLQGSCGKGCRAPPFCRRHHFGTVDHVAHDQGLTDDWQQPQHGCCGWWWYPSSTAAASQPATGSTTIRSHSHHRERLPSDGNTFRILSRSLPPQPPTETRPRGTPVAARVRFRGCRHHHRRGDKQHFIPARLHHRRQRILHPAPSDSARNGHWGYRSC